MICFFWPLYQKIGRNIFQFLVTLIFTTRMCLILLSKIGLFEDLVKYGFKNFELEPVRDDQLTMGMDKL